MRGLTLQILGALCLLLAACSHAAPPPTGRWEGSYDTPDAIVAIRLEITPKGDIFLSAPNAVNMGPMDDETRARVKQRLAEGLVESWAETEPRPMDFDGRVFRKPGGIAPQMEWNPDARQMTVVLYLGLSTTLRVPLRAVAQFSANPFPD